jgi:hypothetical protein
MTVFVPLDSSSSCPAAPSFLVEPDDTSAQFTRVVKAIIKARRIVVVCGVWYIYSWTFSYAKMLAQGLGFRSERVSPTFARRRVSSRL